MPKPFEVTETVIVPAEVGNTDLFDPAEYEEEEAAKIQRAIDLDLFAQVHLRMLEEIKIGDIVRLVPMGGKSVDSMTDTFIVEKMLPDDVVQIAKVQAGKSSKEWVADMLAVYIDQIDVPHLTVNPEIYSSMVRVQNMLTEGIADRRTLRELTKNVKQRILLTSKKINRSLEVPPHSWELNI